MDDDLIFAPEKNAAAEPGSTGRRPWRVAVIDDAPEVHSVTRMVLQDVRFREREIEFYSAYSAAEGKRILAEVPDLAVVFLDVVMESEHAGLELVEYIRNELNNKSVRIILRTGQPGQAPETEVIVKYDINDYKHKAELSAERLFTTLIAALRSYQDLMTIEASRVGLQNIVQGTAQLFQTKSADQFLTGVLMQINAIFQLGDDALLYVRSLSQDVNDEKVMAASGRYTTCVGQSTTYYEFPAAVRNAVRHALDQKSSSYEAERFSIYFYSGEHHEIVIYIDAGRQLHALDIEMIDIFCSNVSVGLANVHLLETLESRVIGRTRELASAYSSLEQSKLALEDANAKLRTMAMTDPLTGIFNRRCVMDVGDKLFNASRRYKWDLAVVLIDIDHFKRVNDTYGHAAGDEVLKQVAAAVHGRLRDSDVFGRLGGEEFIVLAPEADLQAAHLLATGLMETLAGAGLQWNGIPLTLTISTGIALCQPDDKSLAAVFERADQAMYQAKHQGRNQIVIDPATATLPKAG